LKSQSQLVVLISRLLARHAETRVEVSEKAKEPIAVQRARAFLNEDLSGKVTLDQLSEFSGVPPFRLLRAFQRATGLTPHAYQMQARVRVARVLLLRQEPVAAVAAAVGFADQAQMTRAFKSIMGATPGQYRAAAGDVAACNDEAPAIEGRPAPCRSIGHGRRRTAGECR
jgi:AraC-like DNA-binding protein